MKSRTTFGLTDVSPCGYRQPPEGFPYHLVVDPVADTCRALS
jgi:hypothetical protein